MCCREIERESVAMNGTPTEFLVSLAIHPGYLDFVEKPWALRAEPLGGTFLLV
jgi:hypothetical protein